MTRRAEIVCTATRATGLGERSAGDDPGATLRTERLDESGNKSSTIIPTQRDELEAEQKSKLGAAVEVRAARGNSQDASGRTAIHSRRLEGSDQNPGGVSGLSASGGEKEASGGLTKGP